MTTAPTSVAPTPTVVLTDDPLEQEARELEATVRKDLSIQDPTRNLLGELDEKVDTALMKQGDSIVDQLLSDKVDSQTKRVAVDELGLNTQREAARRSALLREPIKSLMKTGSDGGQVATALVNLKIQVEALDPYKFDFEPGWFSRMAAVLPFIGEPLQRYFTQYESSQTVIDAIVRSLVQGRDQLGRDNVTLGNDQERMREMTKRLERVIMLAQYIDKKLQIEFDQSADLETDQEKHRFIGEELIFPVRQRIIDLQQQLAVNQQGVIACEILIRNNRELIRGVDRALNVTVQALEIAVAVAAALAHQEIVLNKITILNKTTSDLITHTASRLRTKGAEIQKQASSAMLDMDSLKTAFTDIRAALDDIAKFRLEALPRMASTVVQLDQMTGDAENTIQKMERGNRARPGLVIDITD